MYGLVALGTVDGSTSRECKACQAFQVGCLAIMPGAKKEPSSEAFATSGDFGRSIDDTGKRCFSNWKLLDCLLAAGR